MPGALEGKYAVVTGGGRGIGAVIARELARHGAGLALIGREPAELDHTCAGLAGMTGVKGYRYAGAYCASKHGVADTDMGHAALE